MIDGYAVNLRFIRGDSYWMKEYIKTHNIDPWSEFQYLELQNLPELNTRSILHNCEDIAPYIITLLKKLDSMGHLALFRPSFLY